LLEHPLSRDDDVVPFLGVLRDVEIEAPADERLEVCAVAKIDV
jgi:hypothetical protein